MEKKKNNIVCVCLCVCEYPSIRFVTQDHTHRSHDGEWQCVSVCPCVCMYVHAKDGYWCQKNDTHTHQTLGWAHKTNVTLTEVKHRSLSLSLQNTLCHFEALSSGVCFILAAHEVQLIQSIFRTKCDSVSSRQERTSGDSWFKFHRWQKLHMLAFIWQPATKHF